MSSSTKSLGGPLDDDPPSGPPPLTNDERETLITALVEKLWRIVKLHCGNSTNLTKDIPLYCDKARYVYYALSPSSEKGSPVSVHSPRHKINHEPLEKQTLKKLSDEQLQELEILVDHSLAEFKAVPSQALKEV